MGHNTKCRNYSLGLLNLILLPRSSQDDNLAKEIKNLRFIVLDEADRMIESGHFDELENILRPTLREDP